MKYNKFEQQIATGGNYARSNLFEVDVAGFSTSKFDVKAASLPTTTVGVIEVPYQNRKLKVPGDRTFQDWTITVINDEGMRLRNELLTWQDELQGFENFFGSDGKTPLQHHRKMTITPLNRKMDPLFNLTLFGWPSEIGSVDLSWETADTVQEYTVTFSITHDNSLAASTIQGASAKHDGES
jgi:hypothetical protein